MPKLLITYHGTTNVVPKDLTGNVITIGALPDNALQIKDAAVSAHHAKIVQENGAYWLEDLDSTNGTYLNGEVITQKIQLKDTDKIRLGLTNCVFRVDNAPAIPVSLPKPPINLPKPPN